MGFALVDVIRCFLVIAWVLLVAHRWRRWKGPERHGVLWVMASKWIDSKDGVSTWPLSSFGHVQSNVHSIGRHLIIPIDRRHCDWVLLSSDFWVVRLAILDFPCFPRPRLRSGCPLVFASADQPTIQQSQSTNISFHVLQKGWGFLVSS